jgi:hypothetical protein
MVGGTSTMQGETRGDAGAAPNGAMSEADSRALVRRPLVRVALFEDLSRHRRHDELAPAPSRAPVAPSSRLALPPAETACVRPISGGR